MMFSTFPQLSPDPGSEDSDSSTESPPTRQDVTQPPPAAAQNGFWKYPCCMWDLQQGQDLEVNLGTTESPGVEKQEKEKEKEVATFDSSVPPPGFVDSNNPR